MAVANATDLLRAAMDAADITDDDERAGIAAICMGESALEPHSEASYAHTSNDRIRRIFKTRCGGMLDAALDHLKVDPPRFFEHVYGGMFGNDEPGDGFNFRGRGLIQLTFKDNYRHYGQKIGVDLVGSPDDANKPETAAKIVVAYIKDRYKGGGFEALKQAVGNSVADVDRRKNQLFQQYVASGEFAAGATTIASAQPEPVTRPAPQPSGGNWVDDSDETASLNRAELDRVTRRT